MKYGYAQWAVRLTCVTQFTLRSPQHPYDAPFNRGREREHATAKAIHNVCGSGEGRQAS